MFKWMWGTDSANHKTRGETLHRLSDILDIY